MLAGGTGITPMYQVLCAILRNIRDKTEIILLYANRSENDILLKTELDMLALGHSNRISVHYILSQPVDKEAWLLNKDSRYPCTRSIGRLDNELVASKCPKGGENTGK